MPSSYDAVIVGSGPNGLSAGIVLARAGLSVKIIEGSSTPGGGVRTSEKTLPGFRHDLCSAIHPLAAGSPFFKSLPLERHGLEWTHPKIPVAHPLDGGKAAILERSLEATAERLGPDGRRYRQMVRPLVDGWEAFAENVLAPIRGIPKDPWRMIRFGMRAVHSAEGLAKASFQTEPARAVFAGLAGHANAPLDRRFTSAFGLMFAASVHAVGWPAPKGGAQRLTEALVGYFRSLGGEIECRRWVRRLGELPPSRAVLFDTTPPQISAIATDALPERYHRSASRFRRGPGAFKLDFALSRPVPWASPDCAQAGTLHLGGTLEEIAESEKTVGAGRCPDRPYLLVAQHAVFDPTRAPAGKHTLWAYCHVPNGSAESMTNRIEAQLERFAPGFKSSILARSVTTPADLERYNPNYLGGDIASGATDGWQLFFRPRAQWNPYRTPNPKLFLCSAAAPPAPGVHGMCGFHAAQTVLSSLERR